MASYSAFCSNTHAAHISQAAMLTEYRHSQADGGTSSTLALALATYPAVGGITQNHGNNQEYTRAGYLYDLTSGEFNRSWESWEHFQQFLAAEQSLNCIELRKVDAVNSGSAAFLLRIRFVCARYGTGGQTLLCWWHVLHAWQQHFYISKNKVLWEKLKAWVRITDPFKFATAHTEIRALSPPDFYAYLVEYWLPARFLLMWSAMYRLGRQILAVSETNMLVEAWHHVLKGKFLEGRRNRRLDYLLHILTTQVVPYYMKKQLRQQAGFEGETLEVVKRREAENRALRIPPTAVVKDTKNDTVYYVASSSNPALWYQVELFMYTCTCPDYPLIFFCKHLHAVRLHFPSSEIYLPFYEPLDTPFSSNLAPLASGNPPLPPIPEQPVSLHRRLTQHVDQIAAFLRLPHSDAHVQFLEHLDNALASVKHFFDTTSLLPKPQHIAPHQNSWTETQAVMMPPKKTRHKRAGDQAYGAGQTSGKKAWKSGVN